MMHGTVETADFARNTLTKVAMRLTPRSSAESIVEAGALLDGVIERIDATLAGDRASLAAALLARVRGEVARAASCVLSVGQQRAAARDSVRAALAVLGRQ